MMTRKSIRRMMLTAAVSTASAMNIGGSALFGFDSTAKPSSSGIQPVQYQPGQADGQANSTVTQELKRMFEESGQPMPSMDPQRLPNAQGQQPHQGQQSNVVRPNPQTAMRQPPKKNFLQKFVGKVTGQDKKEADARVVPPVPPGYRQPTPASPMAPGPSATAQTGHGQRAMQGLGTQAMPQPQFRQPGTPQSPNGQSPNGQSPNGQSPNGQLPYAQSAGANSRNYNMQSVPGRAASSDPTSSPGARQSNVAPLRTAQAVQPNPQMRSGNHPGYPVPAVPGATQTRVASTVPQQAVPRPTNPGNQLYVQPGTAPAFMPSSQVVNPELRVPVQSTVSTSSGVGGEPLPAPPMDDTFEDPFKDSEMEADTSDALDLDSLIEIPKSESAAADSPSESFESAVPVATSTPVPANVSGKTVFVEDGAEHGGGAEELNPFTGVRLNETDAEMFDPGLAESASGETNGVGTESGRPADTSGTTPAESSELFDTAAAPVEEFSAELPAINLPAVEDLEAASGSATEGLQNPNSEEAGQAEAGSTAAASESNSDSTANPAVNSESGDRPAVDVTESGAAPLRTVDAERLQQSSEQDRRLRQQRLILSRAGQTGFKGFCPVELRDRRELIDVNPGFTATFGLQTYAFSSVEARTAFEADPSRYAPAAGGSDVVLLVNSGEEQAGMLDYALWYRDRLYLFRSRETMAEFNNDPQRFANQY